MGRTALKPEVHTGGIAIEQKSSLESNAEHANRGGETVEAFNVLPSKEYAAQLAFMEEPVRIRIEPSSEKNAATMIPIWNNGTGCEAHIGGKWIPITYLQVGVEHIIKRKYVAILAGAKCDTVSTLILDEKSDNPRNITQRITTALATFSVLEDRNPLGQAWLTELTRRNMG